MLHPGDTVTVTISARLVGNDYVWRWDTQLVSKNSPNGAKLPFRQSTFFGSDFSLGGAADFGVQVSTQAQ